MREILAAVAVAVVYLIGQAETKPPAEPPRFTADRPTPAITTEEVPLQGQPPPVVPTGWLGPAVAEAAREQVKPQLSQQCGPEGCFVRPTPRAPASPPVEPATPAAVPVQQTFVSRGACSGGACGVSRPGFFGRVFGRR